MAACKGGVITGVITGTGNPQGGVLAPVGSVFSNGICIFDKIGGGNTAWGWYLRMSHWGSGHYLGSNVVRTMSGAAGVPFGIGMPNGLTGNSGGGSVMPQLDQANVARKVIALRTGFANPSHAFCRAGTIATANDGVLEPSAPANEFAWDTLTVVRTTPNAPGTTATTLADIRLWSGVIVGNLTELVLGGIVDSDTLATAFATQIGLGGGMYAAMWRFSTVAGDAGWSVVTMDDNGVAFAQTVTPIAAIAADTFYRLRLRYLPTPAPRSIRASVNDGPETTITLNAGPNATPGALGMIFAKMQSVVTCKTALATKSLGWTKSTMQFGDC